MMSGFAIGKGEMLIRENGRTSAFQFCIPVTICSVAGKDEFCLNSKSPNALERARLPKMPFKY